MTKKITPRMIFKKTVIWNLLFGKLYVFESIIIKIYFI